MKPLPLDKPTRTTIEALFRDLYGHRYPEEENGAYAALRDKCDALEAKLLDNPKLKKLQRQRDAAHAKWMASHKKIQLRIRKVRQRYQANGLTPAVVKEIQNLVEEANKT